MANQELIRIETDGTVSFGDFTRPDKAKVDDFPYQGNLYQVRTYEAMTKLERDGMFVYESEPGTDVSHFRATAQTANFQVSGRGDTQITLELMAGHDYQVSVDGETIGSLHTNVSGKISIGVELSPDQYVDVRVVQSEE